MTSTNNARRHIVFSVTQETTKHYLELYELKVKLKLYGIVFNRPAWAEDIPLKPRAATKRKPKQSMAHNSSTYKHVLYCPHLCVDLVDTIGAGTTSNCEGPSHYFEWYNSERMFTSLQYTESR